MSDKIEDPILNNLAESDEKVLELNNEVNTLLGNYNLDDFGTSTFFNFENPFFLITLVGLILLAFGLWFLHQELRYRAASHSRKNLHAKVQHSKPVLKLVKEEKVVKEHRKEPVRENKEDKKIIKKKRKIPVVKVK